jgi:hypothetical protein
LVRGLLGEQQTGEDQCGEQPSHANRITVLGGMGGLTTRPTTLPVDTAQESMLEAWCVLKDALF